MFLSKEVCMSVSVPLPVFCSGTSPIPIHKTGNSGSLSEENRNMGNYLLEQQFIHGQARGGYCLSGHSNHITWVTW